MAQSIFANLKHGAVPQVIGGLHDDYSGTQISEAGIGAVIPWAGRLWFNTYPAENGEGGSRIGLWSMGTDLVPVLERPSKITSAARIVLKDKLFISRYVIDETGGIANITGFSSGMRPAGYAVVPGATDYVWALSMAGEIWRINATTYVAELMADNTALNLAGAQAHGKGIWGLSGRLVYALNADGGGRLARYTISTGNVEVLSTDNWPWIEVAGSYDGNGPDNLFYAVGHDNKSVRLWMFAAGITNTPTKFRLPLASRQQLDGWQHEWMRIRQVETERFLMDAYGGFYQMSISTSDKTTTGFPLIEPVSNHARTIPDFVTWAGYLVLAQNGNTPQVGNPANYPNAGQPDSGLLLTTTDELWSYGKPHGEGYWYDNEAVAAGAKSEPMLIRGYDARSLFVSSSAETDIDVLVYHQHREFLHDTVSVTAGGYDRLDLPAADWVAIRPADATTLTAGVVVGSA